MSFRAISSSSEFLGALSRNTNEAYPISVGKIVATARLHFPTYNAQELLQLKDSLRQIEAKLHVARDCPFIIKICIVFLSSLYNLFQGFGFTDSTTLVSGLLEQIGQRTSLTHKGQIPFTKEQELLLSELFSRENQDKIIHHEKILTIQGKQAHITFYGQNIPIFEVDLFPNIIFKLNFYDNDGIRKRYEMNQNAQAVCKEHHLTHLVVPACSLIEITQKGLTTAIVAEEKHQFSPGRLEQLNIYAQQEQHLEEIVRELTVLICKTGLSDIRYDNIPLAGSSSDNLRVVLIDLEPHEKYGSKGGLMGWGETGGWGFPTPGLISCCPRYAETIYATAKAHLPAEEFERMQGDLEKARDKAIALDKRQRDIESFHQRREITAASAAIDVTFIDTLTVNEQQKAILRSAVSDINQVVADRVKGCKNLTLARAWRLTGDAYTVDSNYNETIYQHRGLIQKKLLVPLKETGFIHSILEAEEVEKLGLQYDRKLGPYDLLVQF